MTMKFFNQGFTYIFLLFAVALMGILMATTMQLWHTNVQREKEMDLLFSGRQIRAAIESYHQEGSQDQEHQRSPQQYPKQLEQLLEDNRNKLGFGLPHRHLRRLYIDPMTAKAEWGLIRQGSFIVGVYSLSPQKPLRTTGFGIGEESFVQAKTYMDWRFIANAGD